MRKNLPVTDAEYIVPTGVSIVSKTDLRGIITYANPAFVQASGFELPELIGQPHNLVRHPDMPEQAFEQLWSTVKKGHPWSGIVKNRRRDGGCYWVRAVVVPVRENNQTVGYMSVREAAPRAEIEAAQALYERWRSGASASSESWLTAYKAKLSIRKGFALGSVFVALLMLVGGILGIGGLQHSSTVATALVQQRIAPVDQISALKGELQNMRNGLADFYLFMPAQASPAQLVAQRAALLGQMQAHEAQAEALVQQILRLPNTVGTRTYQQQLQHHFAALQQQVLAPQRALIAGQQPPPPAQTAIPLYLPYFVVLQQSLEDHQAAINRVAVKDVERLVQRNQTIQLLALLGIAFGLFVVFLVGRIFLRDSVEPLERAIRRLDRIAQGDLSGTAEVGGHGETGQIVKASAIMQMHLKVIAEQVLALGSELNQRSADLNRRLFEVSDHTELQYDRLVDASQILSVSYLEPMRQAVAKLLQTQAQARLLLDAEPGQAPDDDANAIFNLIELQALALQDFQQKLEQLHELVLDNRNDIQSAYGLSSQLKLVAEHLADTVRFYRVHKAQAG